MARRDQFSGISVVSIHDIRRQRYLVVDIYHVLECLGTTIDTYWWVATDLQCMAVPTVAEKVPIQTRQVLLLMKEAPQTVNGLFWGYETLPDTCPDCHKVSDFPSSAAVVLVEAFDSSYFFVCTRIEAQIRLVKNRFRDVRDEDPRDYFACVDRTD